MTASMHELSFDGRFLERGFWLYVWEIRTPQQIHLYYVGRTGDSSSSNAQSPFNRMGQHLSANEKSNPLRHYLTAEGVKPEECSFRLVSYGPILPEATNPESHRKSRDRVGAMEKALEAAMKSAGYHVMNPVHSRMELDAEAFAAIRAAFANQLPMLGNCTEKKGGNA
jgi:hypothetical protein